MQGTKHHHCALKSHPSLFTKHLQFAPLLLSFQATRSPGTGTFLIVQYLVLGLGFSGITTKRGISQLPEALADARGLIASCPGVSGKGRGGSLCFLLQHPFNRCTPISGGATTGGLEGEGPSGGPEAIRSFLRGKHPQQLCA